MAQRSDVPKFGNWESGENVPYTAYLDKAGKDRTGTKMINPNDPEENSDLSFYNSSSDQLPPAIPRTDSEHPSGKGSKTPTHELQKSKEDSDAKPFVDSPAHQASQGVGSADNRRRPSRQSTGSEYSIERSPLHRQDSAADGFSQAAPTVDVGKSKERQPHFIENQPSNGKAQCCCFWGSNK